jgi:DNA-binding FrmR family transcriptional regulator
MNHCVSEAFEHGNGDEKIDEVIEILSKVMGK